MVNSIYKFLNEYSLSRNRHPDALTVIRLRSGTYKSKYGSIVHKPVLITLRRVSGKDSTPPDTSIQAILDDKLPFEMSWK